MDIEIKDILKPYAVRPMEGFKHHKTTGGEAFPFCCEYHSEIYSKTSAWAKEFLPEDEALKLTRKTVNQVAYSEHYISTLINHEEWYELISNHIEYNVFSFGSIVNSHEYLMTLLGYLSPNRKRFEYNKAEKLSYLVFSWLKNSMLGREVFLLRKTFELWFNTFPFDLSFFNELKDKYDLFFGMINEDWEDHTEDSFTEALSELTNTLITQINTYKLHLEGKLEDPIKLKLELVVSERKLEVEKGYRRSMEEVGYRLMLREWIKDEKRFLDEIFHLVNSSNVVPVQIYNDKVLAIWDKLQPYKLSTFLQTKEITDDQFKDLLEKHSGREIMPYCIALLHEIGYLTYFFNNFCTNKGDRVNKLMKVFDRTFRKISGNITILGAKSEENSSEYPSIKYIETVRKELIGLK